jgi:hypothetical protein
MEWRGDYLETLSLANQNGMVNMSVSSRKFLFAAGGVRVLVISPSLPRCRAVGTILILTPSPATGR